MLTDDEAAKKVAEVFSAIRGAASHYERSLNRSIERANQEIANLEFDYKRAERQHDKAVQRKRDIKKSLRRLHETQEKLRRAKALRDGTMLELKREVERAIKEGDRLSAEHAP
jgi:predicted RNase H-like nuclease (RuvC/YqgF family)